MPKHLTMLSSEYIEQYSNACMVDWAVLFRNLKKRSAYTVEYFEHYIIASSVFSSKIEGNSLDLNSFMNIRGKKPSAKRKDFEEIEDLVNAYRFASVNNLTHSTILSAYKLLSKTIVRASERGKFRKTQVGVFDNSTGRPVYMAVEPEFVKQEMSKLFSDIEILLSTKLTNKEVFYYASMIHLWIAMIHPFTDGNGRLARLIEKWFLASKLGASAWSINTEKYYWDNRPNYYKTISIGFNYYTLKWERCLPFLIMLPEALKQSK